MADFLVRGTPWLLWGLYACWLAALLAGAPRLARLLRRALPPKALAAAALIALAAVAGRLALPPRHLIYNDELEHADIALNMAERGVFAETGAGGIPEWGVLLPSQWPGGFHALLAPFVRAASAPEDAAFRLNAVLGGLTAGLTGLAAALLFGGLRAGVGAGLILAAWPIHLRLSTAGGLEPNSCFWLAALVLALWAWREEPGRGSEFLALSTAALAAHARLENALLVPALVLAAAPRAPGGGSRAARAVFLLALLGALAVAATNAGLSRPGYAGQTLRPLAQLAANLPGGLRFAASYDSRLLPIAVLAATGALAAPAPWGRLLLAWTAGFFLLHGAYHIGNLSHGGSWRYAAMTALPLIILAGAGLARLWTRSRAIGAAALALCVLPGARLAEPDPGFEESWRLVRRAASSLPADAPVIAFSPSLVRAAARRPAVSIPLLLEPGPRAKELWAVLDRRGAVLLEDEWFRRRPEQARALRELLDGRFRAEVLAEAPGARLSRLTPLPRPRGRLSTAGPRSSPRKSR